MSRITANEFVLAKYPNARIFEGRSSGGLREYQIWTSGLVSFAGEKIGRGETPKDAWKSAANMIQSCLGGEGAER